MRSWRLMKTDKTILIAEPSGMLSSELGSYLTVSSFNTIQVRTLKETLLTLQTHRVDVLVLDAALLDEDCGFISIVNTCCYGIEN